ARAADLYRGDLLEGFGLRDSAAFDDWLFFQAEELRATLASALERLVHGHAVAGAYDTALPYARRLLALDPLHEPAHIQLIHLYAAAGQRAAALRQYDECVRILDEELGLPPSAETTALYEQVRTSPPSRYEPNEHTALPPLPGSSADATVPLRAARIQHNLPAQTTPFVGRKDELEEIVNRLQDPECRLLTLLGPGGVGKTRLALRVAEELAALPASGGGDSEFVAGDSSPEKHAQARIPTFEQGAFFVSLAPLATAEAIVPAVAEALGCSFHTDLDAAGRTTPQEQLLDFLRRKQLLLVMDNYEHLLRSVDGESVAFLVDLLAAAPHVKVLVTSRASLKVEGEHLYPLAGLRVPAPLSAAETWHAPGSYSAVDLFVQAASRARPDLLLSESDWPHVADICRMVEGMPLGILLAAAWTEVLSPAEIAAEIRRSLDFLETDQRDVPARQRSLRAVFDHSWRLLDDREQEVFRGLAVFQGGFTREAALAVVGASVRDLLSLVNKSLLVPTWQRYTLHELLRQYAADRLDAAPDGGRSVRDCHSAYYSAALERWALDLKGARQQQAIAEMNQEVENARAAWYWAVTNAQVDNLARGAEAIWLYHSWRMRYKEGEAALEAAARGIESLDSPDAVRVRARLLILCSYFQLEQGKPQTAATLQQATDLLTQLEQAGHDVRPEVALAALRRARMKRYLDPDPRAAMEAYEQCLALYEEIGDDWSLARVLNYLGRSAEHLGDYRHARALSERSIAIHRQLGNRRGMADTMLNLGVLSWVQGQLDEADRLLRDSLETFRQLDDWNRVAAALKNVGEVLVRRGRFEEGLAVMESSLDIYNDLGYAFGVWSLIPFLAEAQLHLGHYEEADRHGREALKIARWSSHRWGIGFAQFTNGLVALARGRGGEAFDICRSAVAEFDAAHHRENRGWAQGPLGLAALHVGECELARRAIVDAFQVGSDLGAFMPVLYALPAAALLLAHEGDAERARQVHACASRYGFIANSHWFHDVVTVPLAAAIGSLSPPADQRAQTELPAWDEMAAALVSEWAGDT
ncbi:MAG: tetratricopeptide repeat protein, partial [Anaerolineae bacterium]|nr:tetratricopeptide repeat protein [Anaerolineae bacterium]